MSKKQPIDPICALCRITLLNFKGINTKISINEHAVNIQDPSLTQGFFRYYNGDGKEDVFELFYLVTHLIAWFLVPMGKTQVLTTTTSTNTKDANKRHLESDFVDKKKIDENPPECKKIDERFLSELKKMIRYMCIGLEKLQNTYKNGNVVLTIQYYINLLEDGLNGSFDIKRLPHCLVEDVWIDTPLKDKIVETWDFERLHRVCAIYDDCFAEISKNSKLKDEIIDGYLLAIEKLLTTYEKEFSAHLKQWG